MKYSLYTLFFVSAPLFAEQLDFPSFKVPLTVEFHYKTKLHDCELTEELILDNRGNKYVYSVKSPRNPLEENLIYCSGEKVFEVVKQFSNESRVNSRIFVKIRRAREKKGERAFDLTQQYAYIGGFSVNQVKTLGQISASLNVSKNKDGKTIVALGPSQVLFNDGGKVPFQYIVSGGRGVRIVYNFKYTEVGNYMVPEVVVQEFSREDGSVGVTRAIIDKSTLKVDKDYAASIFTPKIPMGAYVIDEILGITYQASGLNDEYGEMALEETLKEVLKKAEAKQ